MSCVLNDKYVNVVAGNIVMLLIAAQLPPAEAAEVILHVWYSARLTKGMLTVIEDYVRKVRLLPPWLSSLSGFVRPPISAMSRLTHEQLVAGDGKFH